MSSLALARVLLALTAGTISVPSVACSVTPGYKVFRPLILRPGLSLEPAPKVTVSGITRGHKEGDPAASCSDAGILVLAVSSDALGYRFEIVEGEFDDVVFPESFVQPTEQGLLRFVWLDGDTNVQEPINVVVEITTLSANGTLSEPLLLRIEDPGRGVR
jgi:hypothetical protein